MLPCVSFSLQYISKYYTEVNSCQICVRLLIRKSLCFKKKFHKWPPFDDCVEFTIHNCPLLLLGETRTILKGEQLQTSANVTAYLHIKLYHTV
jgi:hypothetical protein